MPDGGDKGKKRPTGDYEVGYCRPPVETRFKKGKSGNPLGRRKSSVGELAEAVFRRKLSEKIAVVQNGRETVMTVLEAIMSRQVNDMVAGTPAQRRAGFQQFHKLGWLNSTPEEMRPNESSRRAFLAELAKKAWEAGDLPGSVPPVPSTGRSDD